jgi:hypothetical protein
MGVGALLYRTFAGSLIGVAAFSPSLATSQQAGGTIPSVIRRTAEFSDRGRVYLVNLESGEVSYTDQGMTEPDPTPHPDPPPKPNPKPETPSEFAQRMTIRMLGDFGDAVKTNRAERAELIKFACTATLAQTGGLDLTYDEARTALADVIRLTIKPPLKGFDVLGIYDDFGVNDRDSLIRAMQITEKAFEGVK